MLTTITLLYSQHRPKKYFGIVINKYMVTTKSFLLELLELGLGFSHSSYCDD